MENYFNWRNESTQDITSDLDSTVGDQTHSTVCDTSTATLLPQNSIVELGEGDPARVASTPTAPKCAPSSGRLSLSQPELPAHRTPPARNMSTGNLSGPFGKPPHPHRLPLSKTLEENKYLREELAILKSKLDVETYKVAELTALQPREVQDILEEYYSLQMSKFNLDGERRQMEEERRQMKLDSEAAEVESQTKIEALEAQLRSAAKERLSFIKQIDSYEERIRELEAELADIPTSLDALKGEDSDWTVRSECDIINEELRARLAATENENALLRKEIEEQRKQHSEKLSVLSESTIQGKTFVVGEGGDSGALIKRIDELEARLREEGEERIKISSALVGYMNRCHSLEKKLQSANLSFAKVSLTHRSREDILRLVEDAREFLVRLGKENKELRKECNLLLGRLDQGEISAESTPGVTPNKPNISQNPLSETRLLAEDFEKKQNEVLENLKMLAENAANYDDSVLDLFKKIGTTCAESEAERLCAGVAVEEVDNLGLPNKSDLRTDPSNAAQISLMNSSLAGLIDRSMNTSKHIAGFKARLMSLRGVVQQMFENLRSSGLLFEDVLEVLGSGTDEMRSLAEKIRLMKFEWDSAIDESRVFMEAIEETELSVCKMQVELSTLEQSLNETSFHIDFSTAHTAAAQCVSSDVFTYCKGNEVSNPDQKMLEVQSELALKTQEVAELQSQIEEVREARDVAIASADNLRLSMKQMESKLVSFTEERDRLMDRVTSSEAEKKEIRESLEAQLAAHEQVQRDVLLLRSEMDVLIDEISGKDAEIVELEEKLAAVQRSNEILKEKITERDRKIDSLHTTLDDEQRGRREDSEAWKVALIEAKETSSAFRCDFEKILKELNSREEAVRHLEEKLRISEENNIRMAEVVSGYACSEKRDKNPPRTTAAEVQTSTPISKLKTRGAQTDLTRTSLAQVESDAATFSAELEALHSAYRELSDAIGQLVVKQIEPLPKTADMTSLEKSYMELARLIHHERRRRERQANEVAAMTAKVEDLRQRGVLEASSEAASKEMAPTAAGDGAAQHNLEFNDPNRHTLYLMTSMAMELVTQLRRMSSLQATGRKVDFAQAIEMARKLRNELNDRFIIVRTEKENENKHCLPDLIHMVKILERDNRTLHETVKNWKTEYEALQKKCEGDPEVTQRIADQLRSIHSVMGEFARTSRLLRDSSNTANARNNSPSQ